MSGKLGRKKSRSTVANTPTSAMRKHRTQKLTHKEHRAGTPDKVPTLVEVLVTKSKYSHTGEDNVKVYDVTQETEQRVVFAKDDSIQLSRGSEEARSAKAQAKADKKAEKLARVAARRIQLDEAKKNRDPAVGIAKFQKRKTKRAIQMPAVKVRPTVTELEVIASKIAAAKEEKLRVKQAARVIQITQHQNDRERTAKEKPIAMRKYSNKQTPSENKPDFKAKKGKQTKRLIRSRRMKKSA